MGRGWWFPLNSRRAHYFEDSLVSLCGGWMKLGDAKLEDFGHDSPDNCKDCERRRKKRREQEGGEADGQPEA